MSARAGAAAGAMFAHRFSDIQRAARAAVGGHDRLNNAGAALSGARPAAMTAHQHQVTERAPDLARGEALGMQRARVLKAMVAVSAERGFAQANVAAVCAHAKVSRRTFDELFGDPRECFESVLDDGYERIRGLIGEAFSRERRWQDGLRSALAGLLALFDREPQAAHVWLVETLTVGRWALEHRRRHMMELTRVIVERWPLPEGFHPSELAAPGLVAMIVETLHAHLLTRPREPTMVLLGPLMGFIAAQYLDPPGAAEEAERARELSRAILAGRHVPLALPAAEAVKLPGIVSDPRSHRARACLRYLASYPHASNRQIAQAAGISSAAQISALLARLNDHGLLIKHPGRPGLANAWSLTPYGAQVACAIERPPFGVVKGEWS